MAVQRLLAVLLVLVVCTNSELTRQQMEALTAKARNLPNDECGESPAFDQKIINGSAVSLGAYPWMAVIGYRVGTLGPYWSCAGSLVTDQFVVTAAHCLDPRRIQIARPLKVTEVRLGELDLNGEVDDGASPLDIPVDSVKFHPDYNHDQKTNDIGLIKLKTKVKFDSLKKPICLPPPEFYIKDFEGYTSVVAGWGTTEKGKSTVLSEVSVEIKSIDTCRTNITRALPKAVLDQKVICASSPGKDSCQGDSGAPLMMFRRYKGKAKMFLLGVVSYGYGCATDGYPGVYTRVSHFMDWIVDNLEF